MSSLIKSKLVNQYKKDNDPKDKERLLLHIIRIREDKQIPFRVVKEKHQSNNPWASDWLSWYDKEGVDRLKNRQKRGRNTDVSRKVIH